MKVKKDTQQEKWLRKFGAEHVYNKFCMHYQIKKGEPYCKLKMDMCFCSRKCVYATNSNSTNKVDSYGRVKGVR